MIDSILGLWANRWIAFGLYWLPLVFCAFGYLLRTARNVAKDRAKRVTPGAIYHPTDTLGTLIGRALLAILPVGNIFAAVFDLAPEIFGRFFRVLERVFSQPLVPDFRDGDVRRRK